MVCTNLYRICKNKAQVLRQTCFELAEYITTMSTHPFVVSFLPPFLQGKLVLLRETPSLQMYDLYWNLSISDFVAVAK